MKVVCCSTCEALCRRPGRSQKSPSSSLKGVPSYGGPIRAGHVVCTLRGPGWRQAKAKAGVVESAGEQRTHSRGTLEGKSARSGNGS